MKIDDQRFVKQEVGVDDLLNNVVYVSSRLQRYLLVTMQGNMVCLETGEEYNLAELEGDAFTPVKATLVVE